MSSAVRKQVRACTRCHLRDSCRKPVPITGPTPSPYLVIGEAPGAEEDRKGKVFVGRSGALLRAAIKEAGISLHRVAFCNVVSCRPEGNRTPSDAEVASCRPNLRLQMAAARPQVVVVCGATALKAFQPGFQTTADRGRPWWERGRVFIPTWHPAFVLRHKTQVRYGELLEDLKQARWRVRNAAGGGTLSDRWPEDCRVCHGPVERYTVDGVAYCAGHYREKGKGRQMVMEGVV